MSTRPKSSISGQEECIISLAPGRGESEIGISILNFNSCKLLQISDTCTFAKTLSIVLTNDPSVVILPDNNCKIMSLIKESFDLEIVFLQRKYFNDSLGLDFLKKYSCDGSINICATDQFYALAALSALFTWAESNISLTPKSLTFSVQSLQGILLLDVITIRNLEIIRGNSSDLCLLKVLDHTVTRMGKRLLRMSLCQPLYDENLINNRLDAVQEIDSTLIKNLLKKSPDLDVIVRGMNLISQKPCVKHAEQSINHILSLKLLLKTVLELVDQLQNFKSSLLSTIHNILSHESLNEILEIIDNVINEDVVYQKSSIGLRHQRCFAVKSGYNGLLDVARQTYKETTDDVYDLIKFYSEKYDIPIKSNFEVNMGFFMSIQEQDLGTKNLALEFINVNKKRKNVVFTTLKLMSLNERIHESLTEVYLMSDKAILDIIHFVRSKASVLYKVSECLAMLDMIQSFAHLSSLNQLVRPEFTDTLAIKKGRHPIRSISIDSFVPNDTYASMEANLVLITGPNMSGKSTYLGQICLLSVMAQTGMFVPAEYASFRLCDRIFTRIGSDDNLDANASNFMVEMQQMSLILNNLTENSLVIIDELGRGTSASDGLSISFAICNYLLNRNSFIFFATHFTKLYKYFSNNLNMINLQLNVCMENNVGNPHINYMYTVSDGVCTVENYGIQAAQMAGLDTCITLRALEISKLKNVEGYRKNLLMVESIDMESIRSQALENINLEGLDPDLLSVAKLSRVEVDALVILDIQEHLKVVSPASATGQLLGLDIKDKLEITQSFGLPTDSESAQEFQTSMLNTMKQLNYDANTVGWYTSTWLGSYWNLGLIETQVSYQNTFPQAVLLIYDPACTQTGKFNLLALRLTESFMAKFESSKFGMADMAEMSIYDVFESIPIYIKNAHLLEPEPKNVIKESGLNYPPLELSRVSTNGNELDVEEYLKRHFEFMGDCLDEFGHEAWKWQGWSRAMGKDQSKTKRNVDRTITAEPSRLESLFILNQLETYCKQLESLIGPGKEQA